MAKKKQPQHRSRTSARVQAREAIKKSNDAAKNGTTKPKRFRRPKQRKSCHFFKLPGEIRNQIYSQVVTSPDRLVVSAKGPGEPPLLKVCKLIRKESRSIYYAENQFQLEVRNFDGGVFAPFFRQYHESRICSGPASPKAEKHPVQFILRGAPNWENLAKWVKEDYFSFGGMRPDLAEPITNNDYICSAAFKLADSAREGGGGWKTAENALEAFHHGLKGTCSAWADSESGH